MRTYKELNKWSKEIVGLPFWATLVIFALVEYGISLLPVGG